MRCPQCGAEVQATAHTYLALTPEGWQYVLGPLDVDNIEIYCANDHVINDCTVATEAAMFMHDLINQGSKQ